MKTNKKYVVLCGVFGGKNEKYVGLCCVFID